jgi:hypothetical protein
MCKRKKFLCLDCKVDTGKIGEHYMLTDSTWYQIHNSNQGMICLGCVEKRLGRKLVATDFNDSHVNRPQPGKTMSARFMDRLKSGT